MKSLSWTNLSNQNLNKSRIVLGDGPNGNKIKLIILVFGKQLLKFLIHVRVEGSSGELQLSVCNNMLCQGVIGGTGSTYK